MAIGTAIAIGSAIYGGGKALGLWGQPPEQKYKQSKREQAYLAELEKRSREGLAPSVRFGMQTRATKLLAGEEQKARLRQKGQALFGGTRGVAGREQRKAGTEQMYRQLVESSLSIDDRNELAKLRATEKLGEVGFEESRRESDIAYQNAMAKYGSQQAGISQVLSSLSGISPAKATSMGDIFAKDPSTWSTSELGQIRAFVAQNPGALEELSKAGVFIPQ